MQANPDSVAVNVGANAEDVLGDALRVKVDIQVDNKDVRVASALIFTLTGAQLANSSNVPSDLAPEVWTKLTFSWSGKSMELELAESDRYGSPHPVD